MRVSAITPAFLFTEKRLKRGRWESNLGEFSQFFSQQDGRYWLLREQIPDQICCLNIL